MTDRHALQADLRRIGAYLAKEFRIQLSYRFAFLFWVFGISTTIATYFFIDRMFSGTVTRDLEPFGTSYFAYVLVGNAFFAYVGAAIGGMSTRVGTEQSLGTLEMLLVTPTKLRVLILAIGAWNTVYASAEVALYFLVGGAGFGVDFSQVNWLSLLALLGLVIVVFNSLGLAEAGLLLLLKRSAMGAWVFNELWAVLGGVFFPVTVLPGWLQGVAQLNPITYAIRGLQQAIFQNATLSALSVELAVLAGCAALLIPVGVLIWKWTLERAREEGSLCLH